MSEQNYAEIRKRIEKRYKQRNELFTHAAAFVASNIVCWVIFFLTGSSFAWPILVTLGWGIGLFFHALDYYNKYGGGADRREDAIQREVELEMERRGVYEKPKRRMELTEDGEIEEVYEDEDSQISQRRR